MRVSSGTDSARRAMALWASHPARNPGMDAVESPKTENPSDAPPHQIHSLFGAKLTVRRRPVSANGSNIRNELNGMMMMVLLERDRENSREYILWMVLGVVVGVIWVLSEGRIPNALVSKTRKTPNKKHRQISILAVWYCM